MDEYKVEINYKDIRKRVTYFFPKYVQLAKFLFVCVGDEEPERENIRITAELAAECSKVNTLRVVYGLSCCSAAMLRDLYNYNKIVKRDPYKISVNGVIHKCRPELTLTLRRGK